MYRIYSALIGILAAAVFIIPIFAIYNKLFFHSGKRTVFYLIVNDFMSCHQTAHTNCHQIA